MPLNSYLNTNEEVIFQFSSDDFIIDDYQIPQSKWYGAHAILLIGRILEESQLKDYIKICNEYENRYK